MLKISVPVTVKPLMFAAIKFCSLERQIILLPFNFVVLFSPEFRTKSGTWFGCFKKTNVALDKSHKYFTCHLILWIYVQSLNTQNKRQVKMNGFTVSVAYLVAFKVKPAFLLDLSVKTVKYCTPKIFTVSIVP